MSVCAVVFNAAFWFALDFGLHLAAFVSLNLVRVSARLGMHEGGRAESKWRIGGDLACGPAQAKGKASETAGVTRFLRRTDYLRTELPEA